MKRKNKGEESDTKVEFPWFLVGFIILSILGSYVFGYSIPVSDSVMNFVFDATTCLSIIVYFIM